MLATAWIFIGGTVTIQPYRRRGRGSRRSREINPTPSSSPPKTRSQPAAMPALDAGTVPLTCRSCHLGPFNVPPERLRPFLEAGHRTILVGASGQIRPG
jgi:hypothetical protein